MTTKVQRDKDGFQDLCDIREGPEEGGDGESVVSEPPSLMSYTLKYVSLTDLDRLCQFGL